MGMSRGHDLKITIPTVLFNDLTKVITRFNKRIDKVNAGLKKKKYDRVSRYPAQQSSEDVVRQVVTITIEIKDRAKTLFQELVGNLERFSLRNEHLNERVRVHRGSKPGVWLPCASEEEAHTVAKVLNGIMGSARVEFI
jgi:hypothetical protein